MSVVPCDLLLATPYLEEAHVQSSNEAFSLYPMMTANVEMDQSCATMTSARNLSSPSKLRLIFFEIKNSICIWGVKADFLLHTHARTAFEFESRNTRFS